VKNRRTADVLCWFTKTQRTGVSSSPAGLPIALGPMSSGKVGFIGGCPYCSTRPTGGGAAYIDPGSVSAGCCGAGARSSLAENEAAASSQGSSNDGRVVFSEWEGFETITEPQGSGSSGLEPFGTCAKPGRTKTSVEAAKIAAARDARREKRGLLLCVNDVVFIFSFNSLTESAHRAGSATNSVISGGELRFSLKVKRRIR
jgi:hypothetical protein